MKIIKTKDRLPRSLVNVFVKHTVYDQPYWTRGYYFSDKWKIMTWHGTVEIDKNNIQEWMPMPDTEHYHGLEEE